MRRSAAAESLALRPTDHRGIPHATANSYRPDTWRTAARSVDVHRDTGAGGYAGDGAGGLFDQGLDILLSIEQPNDVCIIPLP